MARELPIELRKAEKEAKKLIEYFGIQSPEHIQLRNIASNLGAEVILGQLINSAARLVRVGNRSLIRISDKERYVEKQRFSLAHELGHLCLRHKNDYIECVEEDMMNWSSPKSQETEANVFAAELLMPTVLIEKRFDVSPVNFDIVEKICKEFRVSLMAAAIRFVRFSSEMCAVVCSKNKRVAWCFRSSDFCFPIMNGKEIDRRTIASDFYEYGNCQKEPEEIDSDAWIDNSKYGSRRKIVEHTFASNRIGFTLSLLWIES